MKWVKTKFEDDCWSYNDIIIRQCNDPMIAVPNNEIVSRIAKNLIENNKVC